MSPSNLTLFSIHVDLMRVAHNWDMYFKWQQVSPILDEINVTHVIYNVFRTASRLVLGVGAMLTLTMPIQLGL